MPGLNQNLEDDARKYDRNPHSLENMPESRTEADDVGRTLLPLRDDVIKWKHFPRYWPHDMSSTNVVFDKFTNTKPVTQSIFS